MCAHNSLNGERRPLHEDLKIKVMGLSPREPGHSTGSKGRSECAGRSLRNMKGGGKVGRLEWKWEQRAEWGRRARAEAGTASQLQPGVWVLLNAMGCLCCVGVKTCKTKFSILAIFKSTA